MIRSSIRKCSYKTSVGVEKSTFGFRTFSTEKFIKLFVFHFCTCVSLDTINQYITCHRCGGLRRHKIKFGKIIGLVLAVSLHLNEL